MPRNGERIVAIDSVTSLDISLLVKQQNDERKCWKKTKKKKNTKNESYTEVNNYKKNQISVGE